MAPGKVSKMKQVCAASPGKFASALLDILDGSYEEPANLPMTIANPISPEKVQVSKRPAAAMAMDDEETPQKKKARFSKDAGRQQTPSKVTKQTKPTKQDKAADQNMAATRRKELKAMKLVQIKGMVVRKGLDVGSKEKMVESIIVGEAKSRANICKHKANVRDVVGKKREEFNGKSNKQLKDLLQAYAMQTAGTKPALVDRLLATWKEQGEVEKVLAGMAFKALKVELNAMDKVALFEMCRKKGVDALSKEVLVERLLVHESVEIWSEVMAARGR